MIQTGYSPYIERLVRVPSFAADAAIDLFLLDLGPGTMSEETRTVELTSGRLVIDGPGTRPAAPRPSATWPSRRLEGWIIARRGLYRVRVEIELMPWSERTSAIGMRPVVRRGSALGLGRYVRIGSEAVERLRCEIEKRAGLSGCIAA